MNSARRLERLANRVERGDREGAHVWVLCLGLTRVEQQVDHEADRLRELVDVFREAEPLARVAPPNLSVRRLPSLPPHPLY